MVQMYFGNGKGKTTAAVGAAVRAAGSGMRVLVAQFFKDGKSGEISAIKKIDNIITAFPEIEYNLFEDLNDNRKADLKAEYTSFLRSVFNMKDDYDMIVLDESIDAYALDVIDRNLFCKYLRYCPQALEIIITGHKCPDEIFEISDYVTEFTSLKHPYNSGIKARRGIEF